MKIEYISKWSPAAYEIELSELLKKSRSDGYGEGAIEGIQSEIEAVSGFVAKLVETLCKKNILTNDELTELLEENLGETKVLVADKALLKGNIEVLKERQEEQLQERHIRHK